MKIGHFAYRYVKNDHRPVGWEDPGRNPGSQLVILSGLHLHRCLVYPLVMTNIA